MCYFYILKSQDKSVYLFSNTECVLKCQPPHQRQGHEDGLEAPSPFPSPQKGLGTNNQEHSVRNQIKKLVQGGPRTPRQSGITSLQAGGCLGRGCPSWIFKQLYWTIICITKFTPFKCTVWCSSMSSGKFIQWCNHPWKMVLESCHLRARVRLVLSPTPGQAATELLSVSTVCLF